MFPLLCSVSKGGSLRALSGSLLTRGLALAAVILALIPISSAQAPVMVLTPGGKSHTIAGTGDSGFAGDNGQAASALLAEPGALAGDEVGNIYVADTYNHRIRRIASDGTITTIAGNGTQGHSGDGGPATAGSLNKPMGVAVDSSGNLYIADTGNHRIRIVSGGVIATFAGTGTAGFGGDNGLAINALLHGPRGIALDHVGNVYFTDTNNHVVRRVSAGLISTVAGNTEQGFSGDGGTATRASLDSPVAVALDSSENLYIADTGNHRLRKVANGIILTYAGTGAPGFSGDGGAAVNAQMVRPRGLAFDIFDNVYVADTGNQVIRRIDSAGVIASFAGSGEQGFGGDEGVPALMELDSPTGVFSNRNIYIGDARNHRIRRVDATALRFADQIAGTASSPQTITVSNSGSAMLNLFSVALPAGPYQMANTGSCGALFPIALAPGSNCTLDVTFRPRDTGPVADSLEIADNAVGSPHIVSLTGHGLPIPTAVTLQSSQLTTGLGQPVTLTASVAVTIATQARGAGGSITFVDEANSLATVPIVSRMATYTSSTFAPGTHILLARYSGDALYQPSVSTALTQTVTTGGYSLIASAAAISLRPGSLSRLNIAVVPDTGFTGQVALTCSPSSAVLSCGLNPATLTPSGSTVSATLTIIASPNASLGAFPLGKHGVSFLYAFGLLIPAFVLLARPTERSKEIQRSLLALVLFLAGLIPGCSSTQVGVGKSPRSYTATVSGLSSTGGSQEAHQVVINVTVE